MLNNCTSPHVKYLQRLDQTALLHAVLNNTVSPVYIVEATWFTARDVKNEAVIGCVSYRKRAIGHSPDGLQALHNKQASEGAVARAAKKSKHSSVVSLIPDVYRRR